MNEPNKYSELADAIADGRPIDWSNVKASGSAPTKQDAAFQTLDSLRQYFKTARSGSDDPSTAAVLDYFDRKRFSVIAFERSCGFGISCCARDRDESKTVWLKVIVDESQVFQSNDDRTRFVSELKQFQKLRETQLGEVYSIMEDQKPLRWICDDGAGDTIEHFTRRMGLLAPVEAAAIGKLFCGALRALHKSGVAYKDIAPRVVRFSAEKNQLFLPPLSPLRSVRSAQELAYAAPEILDSAPNATPLSDIYSIGAILYFLVSGRSPFQDLLTKPTDLRRQILLGKKTPLQAVRPDLRGEFVNVIDRAMAGEPNDRFDSLAALGSALDRFIASQSPRKRGRLAWLRLPFSQ